MVGPLDILTSHSIIEYNALKYELLLRILLQNILLFLMTGIFTVVSTTIILFPNSAWSLCLAYSVASAAIGAQWCHHGVRIAQLKHYIMLVERDIPRQLRWWECWLPDNRPKTFLGSKWMLATKGVLIGLQSVVLGLCIYISSDINTTLLLLSMLLLVGASALVLTNEQERVLEEREVQSADR